MKIRTRATRRTFRTSRKVIRTAIERFNMYRTLKVQSANLKVSEVVLSGKEFRFILDFLDNEMVYDFGMDDYEKHDRILRIRNALTSSQFLTKDQFITLRNMLDVLCEQMDLIRSAGARTPDLGCLYCILTVFGVVDVA